MRKEKWLKVGIAGAGLAMLFCLFPLLCAAEENDWEAHSHRLLYWDGRQAAESKDAPPEGETEEGTEGILLPVDIWLESTPNFGGMYTPLLSNKRSIYMERLRNALFPEGGFHYLREDGSPSWYAATLRALAETAQKDPRTFGRVRILRYGDEMLPSDFLTDPDNRLLPAGASDESKSAVRRDMMTYAINPEAHLWTSMAQKTDEEAAYSFYIPTSASNYRLMSIASQYLEMRDLHAQMAEAQEKWRALLTDAETKGEYTLSAEGGMLAGHTTPLAYALDNMNWNNLNILSLDTLGYPGLVGTQMLADGNLQAISHIEELFRKHGAFTPKGVSVGVIACRADYMGFITRIGGVSFENAAAEALLWGRKNQELHDGVYRNAHAAPAPRTFLLLLIGPPDAVDFYIREMESAFGSEQFAQERGLRRRGSSSFWGELPFFYGNEARSVGTFTFDYRTYVIRAERFSSYTQMNQNVSVLCDTAEVAQGANNQVPLVTLAYDPEKTTANDNDTIQVLFRVGEASEKFAHDQSAYGVQVLKQLALRGAAPNDPKTISELQEQGMQLVLKRDKVYVYEPGASASVAMFEKGQMSIESDGGDGALFVLPVVVNRETLRPGFYRISLTIQIESRTINHEPLPSWTRSGGKTVPPLKDGEPWIWDSEGDFWGFSPDITQIGNWLDVAAHAREVGDRAEKLGDLEHAWFSKGKPKAKTTPNLDFNLPPVFRVFYLEELLGQIQRASEVEMHTLIEYTFDVHVVFAEEERA